MTDPVLTSAIVSRIAAGEAFTILLCKFQFAFDAAGLSDGIAAFSPLENDYLLDGWVNVVEAWDGTTPTCDFGPDDPGQAGLVGNAGSSGSPGVGIDMTLVDGLLSGGTGYVIGYGGPNSLVEISAAHADSGVRIVPGRFVAPTVPVKVWVTQDGVQGGDAPGASAGSGVLNLLIGRPISSAP